MFRRRPQASATQGSRASSCQPRWRVLSAEALERRHLLATITVNSLADPTTDVPGQITLRDAINASIEHKSVNGSVAGTGSDTIEFDPKLTGGTIALTHATPDHFSRYFGPSAFVLPGGETLLIDGLDRKITIKREGSQLFRFFEVQSGAYLSLNHITLVGGIVKGSNGADGGFDFGYGGGGGGAAGMGGAIFSRGHVDVLYSTLEQNFAIGGNGGTSTSNTTGPGGGGGGVDTTELSHGDGGNPNGGTGGAEGTMVSYPAINGGNGGDGGGGGGGGNQDFPTNPPYGYSGIGGDGGFGGGGGGGGPGYSDYDQNGDGGTGGEAEFGGGGGGGGTDNYDFADHSSYGGGSIFGGGGGAGGYKAGEISGAGGGGGGAGLGGAIYNEGGFLHIYFSTFTLNSAIGGEGGAASVEPSGVAGQAGDNGGAYGGAIFNDNGSSLIFGSTISLNTVQVTGSRDFPTAGGVYYLADGLFGGSKANAKNATMQFSNTILAGNLGSNAGGSGESDFFASDLAAPAESDHSLIGTGTIKKAPDTIFGVDPKLAGVADNGGDTPTMALQAGSPAIGAGTVENGGTDQRGVLRPATSNADIGAFQTASFTATADSISAVAGINQDFLLGHFSFPVKGTMGLSANVTWGDTTPGGLLHFQFATIVSDPSNPNEFDVYAPHEYMKPGAYLVTVNVQGYDASVSLHSAADVLAPTMVTLTSSHDEVPYGQTIDLTATVGSASVPSEGTVTFSGDGIVLGTAPVAGGSATLKGVQLAMGTHLLTASYSDPNGKYSPSSTTLGAGALISTVAGGSGDNLPATAATLDGPYDVAVDAAGDLYISDTGNNRIRRVDHATGVITTVAGTGAAGFSGDGGPATAAELDQPYSIALDAAGDLFIDDYGNQRIREVNHATGAITTVAGNGTEGFAGDGGAATTAELNDPYAIALDASGNLFIADTDNERVREVDHATGTIKTVAGNGQYAFSGDGGPATAAAMSSPGGIAVDASGNLFISDQDNGRIREVDRATGTITTIAGGGTAGLGDGGKATAAQLSSPSLIVLDGVGNLLIADSGDDLIRKLELSTDVISTLAGDGKLGFSGDGGPATAAALAFPFGIAVDGADNLYIVDYGNDSIRKVDHASGVISTVAGSANGNGNGDGGLAIAAAIHAPHAIAFDASGNLFIADTSDNRVREVNRATGAITTVAGGGTSGLGDGGAAISAKLSSPMGIAFDAAGNLYIADLGDNRVREVNHATGTITTVAGNGTAGFAGDGGAATAAELNEPFGLAFDVSGNLFIADASNNRVREIDRVTGDITTVAGGGNAGLGDGGSVTSAELAYPTGLAIDADGNLLIGDHSHNRVRQVDLITGVITTIAGRGKADSLGDGGPATAAGLNGPVGIAVDAAGDVWIADEGHNAIREINRATGTIDDVVGQDSGPPGFAGDGGLAPQAQLNAPNAVAFDAAGNLFIADTDNNRIREVANGAAVNVTQTSVSGSIAAVEDVYVIGTGAVTVAANQGVLVNDTPSGALSVVAGTVTGATGGTFKFNADGSFTYTPPAGFAGYDYAKYSANDGHGNQASATVNVLSQPGGVIWKFFEQVLHRNPAATDLAFFIPLLAKYGPGVLSADFFESDELLSQIITGYYQQYLGRAPQGDDLSFWENIWHQTGGPEGIKAEFAQSPEFNSLANNASGMNPAGWITALYQRILNRSPQGNDLPFWEQQLADGVSEHHVALDFFTSAEAYHNDVTGWFDEYLGRVPTDAELTQYANEMLAGQTDRDIEQQITNLPEYGGNPPPPATGTAARLPNYLRG